jgi:NAD(P)-dependent dehydrogenase (short-subunit alcohol dehydrogenase family)
VTDGDAVSSVVAQVEQNVGPLDVVVANAGYGLEGIFEESPLAEVRRQFEVNVYHASQESREKLQKPSSTCEHIWVISAGPTA